MRSTAATQRRLARRRAGADQIFGGNGNDIVAYGASRGGERADLAAFHVHGWRCRGRHVFAGRRRLGLELRRSTLRRREREPSVGQGGNDFIQGRGGNDVDRRRRDGDDGLDGGLGARSSSSAATVLTWSLRATRLAAVTVRPRCSPSPAAMRDRRHLPADRGIVSGSSFADVLSVTRMQTGSSAKAAPTRSRAAAAMTISTAAPATTSSSSATMRAPIRSRTSTISATLGSFPSRALRRSARCRPS